ncbi:MFS transporter [Geomicrobium sp. JCM 19038]|uniref:MFS transporter n=1 Tax=Geomicrobium sp. JCM 19038 TaxID=1460635 RepID=UPI00045F37D2|nr:glycoside-pentoside-hexuronide (GPH):cation symporter [Geomicrobium sp. JCM 19038]GAK10078.1 xyloside transporter XynT [Geomicrobium sp. JCM 19038]
MLSREITSRVQPNLDMQVPPKKELWFYGFGAYATFSLWTMVGTFLTFYYTDVVGLAAGVVGTLMLVSRVFDGVTDILMGVAVDKTKSKHGKARPWLIWGSVPLGIAIVAVFSVPEMAISNQVMYAYVTFFLFIIMYTFISIPYKSLMGMLTLDPKSRSMANIYSTILNLSGALIVTVITQPLASAIGWTTVAIIYATIAVVLLYITFLKTKERVVPVNLETVGVKEGISALFRNKYWIVITVYCILFYTLIAVNQGSGLYYATWVLENQSIYPLLGISSILPMVITLFFVGPFVLRFGKRNTVLIGIVICIVGNALKIINPFDVSVIVIGNIIAAVGVMPTFAVLFAMINDTAEYGEYKTGKRTVGLVNSGASFGIKVGTGVGLASIGWLLSFGGYLGTAAEQTPLALQTIIFIGIYLPIIISVLMFICLSFFTLDKHYKGYVNEIQRRKEDATKRT